MGNLEVEFVNQSSRKLIIMSVFLNILIKNEKTEFSSSSSKLCFGRWQNIIVNRLWLILHNQPKLIDI